MLNCKAESSPRTRNPDDGRGHWMGQTLLPPHKNPPLDTPPGRRRLAKLAAIARIPSPAAWAHRAPAASRHDAARPAIQSSAIIVPTGKDDSPPEPAHADLDSPSEWPPFTTK